MPTQALPFGVLRRRRDHSVGAIELFFDLVYVFTIIQLSHYLLYDVSFRGAAEALVLFFAVWWGWNYTAWAMNWLDPDHAGVRGLLAVLMFAALVMAIAIPDAFADSAALFVGGYVFLQLVRSAFMVWAFRGQLMARNYAQLLSWSVFASIFWISGVFLPDDLRLVAWIVAVALDYLAPLAGFYLPRIGATSMADWPLTEEHLAERNRLFFIIALGESILVLGFTLSDIELTAPTIAGAVTGFVTIVFLWWLYFSFRHGNVERKLRSDTDATTAARGAYAYAHALMVGGAIVVAVGIELVTSHPMDTADVTIAAIVMGGPAIYLVGNIIFNKTRNGVVPSSRVYALLAVAGLFVIAGIADFPGLVVAIAAMAVLVILGATTGELRSCARG
ncbi:low temperature requirement protein A [Hoyosella sp. YIM 151337]|uniref:low temperature requirement protein A n=1 Tax=Hoyosella sp. YIM 151337 TaxID=2992742 RepID=UPI0022354A4B|nr:low temperature requirement protein A [Hoyosella sp. YIM 151337]MCW4352970.1 low temperature requirement protein A [Hoyosella sp. YIM 151337]